MALHQRQERLEEVLQEYQRLQAMGQIKEEETLHILVVARPQPLLRKLPQTITQAQARFMVVSDLVDLELSLIVDMAVAEAEDGMADLEPIPTVQRMMIRVDQVDQVMFIPQQPQANTQVDAC